MNSHPVRPDPVCSSLEDGERYFFLPDVFLALLFVDFAGFDFFFISYSCLVVDWLDALF